MGSKRGTNRVKNLAYTDFMDNPPFTLNLLKEIRLLKGEQPVLLPSSRKVKALLVWLALEPRWHDRQALAELLWGETDDPRGGLRWALSKLKPAIEPALQIEKDRLRIIPEALSTDIQNLKACINSSESVNYQQLKFWEEHLASGYLNKLDVCQGSSAAFELWLESQRMSLRDIYAEILHKLILFKENDPIQALHWARKLLSIAPHSLEAAGLLLQLQLQHEGIDSAQQGLEKIRHRWQLANIDETELLSCWRKISNPGKIDSSGAGYFVVGEEGLNSKLSEKPSIAVLNFLAQDNGDTLIQRGLTSDLISRLSRLSGLLVIAQGSSSRFNAQHSPVDIGKALAVRYLIQGRVHKVGQRIRVYVDLIETTWGQLIWSEVFERAYDDIFLLQDEIVSAIVSAVEIQVEHAEFERARVKPPESLDAWENYHMALWHCFRFTGKDTEQANNYLQRALRQDSNFSRAHSALSLVHYSRAFLNSSDDVISEIEQSLISAQNSLSLDVTDAMGHWSLGRALFIHKDHDPAIDALNKALQLNPNYAQGHYAKGFICAHADVASNAFSELDAAQRLSPCDPLLFAMKSSRAISFAMEGRFDEAALWAVKATYEPNAHFHIYAIAAACLQLAGKEIEAMKFIETAKKRHPGYTKEIFFRSFPYKNSEQKQLMWAALEKSGL